jgi:hypothetical protein
LNASFSIDDDARPKPGDFTVCIRCGHLMCFGDDLSMRELTDAEMIIIASDQRLLVIQAARKEIFGKRMTAERKP